MTQLRPSIQDIAELRADLAACLTTANDPTERAALQATLAQNDPQLVRNLEHGSDIDSVTGESLVWAELDKMRISRHRSGRVDGPAASA